MNGGRNAEQGGGFRVPDTIRSVHLEGLSPPAVHPAPLGGSPLFGSGLLDAAPTWDDVAWLRQNLPAGTPLWLKGILDPDEARLALAHGSQAGQAQPLVSRWTGHVKHVRPATKETGAQLHEIRYEDL